MTRVRGCRFPDGHGIDHVCEQPRSPRLSAQATEARKPTIKTAPRIDEFTRWRLAYLVDQQVIEGDLAIVRAVGDLGYAQGGLLVVDIATGRTFPLSSVVTLTP